MRDVLRGGAALQESSAGEFHAQAQDEKQWRHGLSLFGDPKYPANFKNFDYVNASAPKGGMVRLIAFGTFDNLNLVVAVLMGSLAGGVYLVS